MTCSRAQAAKHMREELKMNRQELIESLNCIEDCISEKSSEDEKITVLEDLKPSSLRFILDEVIGYIEMW